jgi:hypothetical protein
MIRPSLLITTAIINRSPISEVRTMNLLQYFFLFAYGWELLEHIKSRGGLEKESIQQISDNSFHLIFDEIELPIKEIQRYIKQ